MEELKLIQAIEPRPTLGFFDYHFPFYLQNNKLYLITNVPITNVMGFIIDIDTLDFSYLKIPEVDYIVSISEIARNPYDNMLYAILNPNENIDDNEITYYTQKIINIESGFCYETKMTLNEELMFSRIVKYDIPGYKFMWGFFKNKAKKIAQLYDLFGRPLSPVLQLPLKDVASNGLYIKNNKIYDLFQQKFVSPELKYMTGKNKMKNIEIVRVNTGYYVIGTIKYSGKRIPIVQYTDGEYISTKLIDDIEFEKIKVYRIGHDAIWVGLDNQKYGYIFKPNIFGKPMRFPGSISFLGLDKKGRFLAYRVINGTLELYIEDKWYYYDLGSYQYIFDEKYKIFLYKKNVYLFLGNTDEMVTLKLSK